MSNKFNIVQKPKKSDDSNEEEVEVEVDVDSDDDEDVSSSKNDYLKHRMTSFMLIVVGVLCLLLLVLYLISLGSNKKYTYSDVEKILKEAAISYFADHPEHLPTSESSIVEIDSSNLVSAGKMKNISDYLGADTVCSGTVQVAKVDTDYVYTPYLNCGEQYSTVELYRKVLSNEKVVSSGYGLYQTNGAYVYRGEIVNNYVNFGGKMWRILKITSNNNVVLISEDGVGYPVPWDDRYSEERLYDAGINTYNASRAREYLSRVYTIDDPEDDEFFLSKKNRAKIIPYNICVGKRLPSSSSKDNSEECKDVLRNQKLGLLTLSEYLYASIDPNCKTADSLSCKNYNYLAKNYEWWLATANKENTYSVFMVGRSGAVKTQDAANYAVMRPVIFLSSGTLYKSGNGTEEKPYKIR